MSRYIDADALIDRLDYCVKEGMGSTIAFTFKHMVEEAPSIDIVRCKECRWGKPYSEKQLECDALGLGGLKFPDDFCSYGQKERASDD